jgi:hypothetical protein
MWYFAVTMGLAVMLATAGFIQVLWLEAELILDETVSPHEDFPDEASKNRHAAGLAQLEKSMSDGSR